MHWYNMNKINCPKNMKTKILIFVVGLDKLSSDFIVFHAGTSVKDGNIVTSGGRVLAVVAVDQDLEQAAAAARKGASAVNFEGAFFRDDIAHKALKW